MHLKEPSSQEGQEGASKPNRWSKPLALDQMRGVEIFTLIDVSANYSLDA